VTDSNDPTSRRGRRPGREPPTIDLKATVTEKADEASAGETHPGQGQDETAAEGKEPESLGSHPPAGAAGASRPETGPKVAAYEAAAKSGPAAEPVGPTAPVSDADMAALEPDAPSAGETGRPATGAERPEATPQPRHGPGYGGLILSGLIGGVAGAALLAAFQTWRPTALPADPRVAALEQQIAGLRRPEAMQDLSTRIGSVEAAQNALAQRVQGAQGLAEQAATQAKEALNRPPPQPQTNGALADLGNRVKALEGASAGMAKLDDRIGALESASGTVKDLGSRLNDLDAQLADRGRAAAQAAQSTGTALQGLDRRVSDLDQRLTALNRQIAEGGSEAIRAGTRVVLASRLDEALKTGAPFPEVLSALKRFDTAPDRLQALEPLAQKGAPTASELNRSFEPLAAQILREAQGGAGSWTDRLARMAERVVTVRPVDQPESAGIPALVARIRNALDRGDVETAAAAWDKLPEPDRRLSQDWGQQLKQRAAAQTAASAIATDAVAALNSSTR
jgi:cell division septum initiation protein DivIVA